MCLADPRAILKVALAAGAALALAPAAEAAIVVASSGPSAAAYPVGRKLDDKGSVVLKAGDTVTVLDAKGTRVLRGAGSFAVAAPAGGPAKSSTFAVLTMQRSAQRVRTGAVRTGVGSEPAASPNLWFVDLAKPGKRCLVAGQPLRLWRLDTGVAATYSARLDGAASVPLAFPAGAMIASWDMAKRPVKDGSVLELAQGAAAAKFTFAVLPSQPADAEAMAATLIANGCTAQLDLLSSTLTQP
ncbi:hypothetical protein H7F51_00935 [Novosphingobium flavum]|uniref:Uncharacterized protein n=1 Tax=Novosphingobium flavum TaxID=1778672 RepID=A0A7X1FNI5_9SPHN|nr:hypothetical protein [Novosphingobium flavum]MBC2664075.1 hypothetical protein [Novosphingobium flavum]